MTAVTNKRPRLKQGGKMRPNTQGCPLPSTHACGMYCSMHVPSHTHRHTIYTSIQIHTYKEWKNHKAVSHPSKRLPRYPLHKGVRTCTPRHVPSMTWMQTPRSSLGRDMGRLGITQRATLSVLDLRAFSTKPQAKAL